MPAGSGKAAGGREENMIFEGRYRSQTISLRPSKIISHPSFYFTSSAVRAIILLFFGGHFYGT